MKTPPFFLLALGATLLTVPLTATRADDATTPATPTPSVPSGDRAGRFKAALAQLNLSDDQKAKIKDIFTNTQAGPERRQQIAAVLTPEQKEKLKQMIKEQRGDGTNAPAAN